MAETQIGRDPQSAFLTAGAGVHRAGVHEAAGCRFAVPLPPLIPLNPADARAELGLH